MSVLCHQTIKESYQCQRMKACQIVSLARRHIYPMVNVLQATKFPGLLRLSHLCNPRTLSLKELFQRWRMHPKTHKRRLDRYLYQLKYPLGRNLCKMSFCIAAGGVYVHTVSQVKRSTSRSGKINGGHERSGAVCR